MQLEITNLHKEYHGVPVLGVEAAALEFQHCLAMVGPSGGGKSTLLRILAGLEIPESGTVRIDGQALPVGEKDLRNYRRTIGVVFQAFNLFPHLTALENIVLPLVRVHGQPKAAAVTRARELLERFQLAAHAEKKPFQLSGGQRQRVAIIRAIATRPRFLLMDEPTSALDPEMTLEVLEFLLELRGTACPLILVTHEIGFARAAADRMVFLREGRIECDQPTAEFFELPRSEALGRFLSHSRRFA